MVGGGRLLRGPGHLAGAGEAAIGQAVWIAGLLARGLCADQPPSCMHAFNITFVHAPVSRRQAFWILHVQYPGCTRCALLMTPPGERD